MLKYLTTTYPPPHQTPPPLFFFYPDRVGSGELGCEKSPWPHLLCLPAQMTTFPCERHTHGALPALFKKPRPQSVQTLHSVQNANARHTGRPNGICLLQLLEPRHGAEGGAGGQDKAFLPHPRSVATPWDPAGPGASAESC